MRFPVFAAHSNPLVDRYLLKKKLPYIQQLIDSRAADWVDLHNQAKGVLLRGRFLPERDHEQVIAGSGFDTAWAKIQSGYAGPLTWQLKTDRHAINV